MIQREPVMGYGMLYSLPAYLRVLKFSKLSFVRVKQPGEVIVIMLGLL